MQKQLSDLLRIGLAAMVIPLSLNGPRPHAAWAAPETAQLATTYAEDFKSYAYKDSSLNVEWNIWEGRLEVRPYEGYFRRMYEPAIAAAANGDIVVVWSDERNGGNDLDIYAQRLDPKGNRLWQEDVRVNSDSAALSQEKPDVAIDTNGNAWVVWNTQGDLGLTGDNVYAQKLGPDGSKQFVSDLRVNSDSSGYGQTAPSVATHGTNVVIVWSDDRNFQSFSGSSLDIYAQKLNATGGKLWDANDVQVNSNTAGGLADAPSVAVDANGDAYVVWGDSRNTGNHVFGQKLNANGVRQWNINDVGIDTGPAVGYIANPDIAIIGSQLYVAWDDSRNSGTTNTDIYAQRLVPSTGAPAWANDVRVNSDASENNQFEGHITVDAAGNAYIGWGDFRNNNNDIYGQKLLPDGSKQWGANDLLISDGGGRDNDYPGITTAGNDIVAVWNDHRNGSNIYAQRLNLAGVKQWRADDVRVDTQQGPVPQFDPTLGVDSTGNTFVAWTDKRYGETNVYLRKVAPNGVRLWDADVRVNAADLHAESFAPVIALVLDNQGNAIIVWEDYRNDPSKGDIYAQKMDTNGNRVWLNEVRVNSDSGSTRHATPAIATDSSGNVIIAWEDARNGNSDIYAQRLNASGIKQWSAGDVRVNTDSGTAHQFGPGIAIDSAGNAIVAWEDRRSNVNAGDIYAQKLNTSGTRQWAVGDVRVNDGATGINRFGPQLAADGNNVFVAWSDARLGDFDVYAQRLNSSGVRQWTATDVRVNSDAIGSYQYIGGIASNGSGSAVITWEDYRDQSLSGLNIYAQKLNSAGAKQWLASDVRVNTDIGENYQAKPGVTLHSNGDAIFAWEDNRNLNADIYLQRYNSTGAAPPLWGGDLGIIEIDRFFYPTSTVTSLAVDTFSSPIVAATLNITQELRGGSAQYYLSNNGGLNWTQVQPGVAQVFTSTGSDLRWRADLGSDLVWSRTPFVSGLQIDYTDVLPNADRYESDDTCPNAKRITMDGAAQAHTFHQANDSDWVQFNVVSGTTYILQTANAQSNADTVLELRADCPQPPIQSNDNSFGNDARLTWKATFTGGVYARIANEDGSKFGTQTGYDLSVRALRQSPVALIVAGRNNAGSLANNISHITDVAYRTFLALGLPKSNIKYLSTAAQHDVDGNGANDDISGPPNPTDVRNAIQDWAREHGVKLGVPFYIYLADHGAPDTFLATGNAGVVTASDLNLWLGNLEATSGADNINVIIEACRSGSFINVTADGPARIGGRNRVVIASTASNLDAYASANGAYFSDVFWTALGENRDLKTAFERGRAAVAAVDVLQTPWLDDNGDGMTSNLDGDLAGGRGFGSLTAGIPPVIDSATNGLIMNGQTLQARVRDDVSVSSVRIELYPPDFVPPGTSPDGTTRVLDVPTVALTGSGPDAFSASYNGFTQTGVYRLVVYASDGDGNQALPFTSTVTVTVAPSLNLRVYLPVLAAK